MKKKSLFEKAIALILTSAVSCGCLFCSASSAESYSVSFPAEGDYIIASAADRNYAIDLAGGDTQTYTPFQLYEKNYSNAQIFALDRVDGDWYIIYHKQSGKTLNVVNGESFNDARFWLHPWDNTDACLFRFADLGYGSYAIQNKLGDQRVIDLHEGNPYNGATVHLWDVHFGTSARWFLEPVNSDSGSGSSSSNNSSNPSPMETAIAWAIDIANDDSHGYSQSERTGPDYDCSSFVGEALRQAGFSGTSGFNTRNMGSILLENGFTYIEGTSDLQRGDILWRAGHTELYIGDDFTVGAHSSRGNRETGDQTGTEVSVAPYSYSGSWNGLYRYTGSSNNSFYDNEYSDNTSSNYFPACSGSYNSIKDALRSIGADSSYSYRKQIAAANDISGYKGSASQNIKMLNLLKAGKLRKP